MPKLSGFLAIIVIFVFVTGLPVHAAAGFAVAVLAVLSAFFAAVLIMVLAVMVDKGWF